ncbi:hypothetical protein TNCV_4100511 [Trichonephila clavipes]|nr:hypothetical protein TNCV_4100511 [Trichonephila clavipes]
MLSLQSSPSPSLLASNGLLFNALSSNEVQPHTEVEPSNTELVQHVEALDTEVLRHSPNHEPSLDSIEILPTNLSLNFSHMPVSVHCISPRKVISPIQMQELKEFLDRDQSNGTGGLFAHHCSIEEPPRQSALEFSTSGGTETTCQALEHPSQNERVLEEMAEWKQEWRSFLDQFKNDMATKFTLTTEQIEKISKLLETLHPVQPSSEPSAESKVYVDEISTKLFDTFEKLLHRKLSKDHLKHMLKTFQQDEHFNLLESNIRAVMKKTLRQKVLNHVNNTKYRVKEVIESFFKNYPPCLVAIYPLYI